MRKLFFLSELNSIKTQALEEILEKSILGRSSLDLYLLNLPAEKRSAITVNGFSMLTSNSETIGVKKGLRILLEDGGKKFEMRGRGKKTKSLREGSITRGRLINYH